MAIGSISSATPTDPNTPIRFYAPERGGNPNAGIPNSNMAWQGETVPGAAAAKWTLESDPVYQQALASGQSAFNRSRANALAGLQNTETAANRQLKNMEQTAAGSRRQLAGNYAARGMGRGAYGAYYRAQDQQNAEQIAAQTSVKDQLAALNQNFLANYGALPTATNPAGTDWLGTTIGQDYRNQAIQQALTAQLAKYGV